MKTISLVVNIVKRATIVSISIKSRISIFEKNGGNSGGGAGASAFPALAAPRPGAACSGGTL